MTPEGRVKKKLKAYLDGAGIYYYMPVPGGYGRPTVDFLCCQCGQFIAIETKAGKNKLTALQEHAMHEMAQAGAQCWLVTLEDDTLFWEPCG